MILSDENLISKHVLGKNKEFEKLQSTFILNVYFFVEMKKRSREKEAQKKITRLVRELIGGRPINQIPNDLIPQIRQELESSKKRAIKDGYVSRLQMIHKVIIDLEMYEKNQIYKNIPENNNSNKNKKVKENDVEIEKNIPVAVLDSILDDLVYGFSFDIAETPKIPALINRAKEKIDQLLSEGDYSGAQKLENIHIRLVALKEERYIEKKKDDKKTMLLNLIAENQQKLEDARINKKEELQLHDMKIKSQIDQKQNEFNQINQLFDEETNGPLPPAAKKLSSATLNTRERERFLIQSRRYEEAATIRAEADELEAMDLENSRFEFIKKREAIKRIEISKQEKQIQRIKDNGERTRQKIKSDYDKQINELEKAIDNFNSRLQRIDNNILNADGSNKNSPNSKSNFINSGISPRISKPATPRQVKRISRTPSQINNNPTNKNVQQSPFVTQATPRIFELAQPKMTNQDKNLIARPQSSKGQTRTPNVVQNQKLNTREKSNVVTPKASLNNRKCSTPREMNKFEQRRAQSVASERKQKR
ncbi:hypothetical protein TRFO_32604 [Tritrichomonas foetus]|uniref:Uncharacterized protein n=1 Tax=Tritrichomonas foetus TaxID=1144522 RepID=A0A1J4JTP4_9EUKA|nr:hypothetical protein TRFO_32604 [Tritrichomonas foetus]|eukprot:OHT00645.1 hypothetical protein TRFO_32604 [Tritrichomonas foetus]